jgi:hypothetical protein
MDLRAIVECVILDYARIPYAYEPDLAQVPVFDPARGQYALMVVGWGAKGERVHYCLIHVAIRGDTIWIEHDGTEEGVAADLERAGIGKDRIVLAFHRPEMRRHTGYAVAQ